MKLKHVQYKFVVNYRQIAALEPLVCDCECDVTKAM